MRLTPLAALAAVSALALGAPAVHATTFYLSFSGPDGMTTGGPIALTVLSDGGGKFTVTSATGDIDGEAVTLLTPFAFLVNDNFAFTSTPNVDADGISFSTTDHDYNVFWDVDSYGLYQDATFDTLTSFSLSAPEPATWALMLAGFAGLGAALRSRRRVEALAPRRVI